MLAQPAATSATARKLNDADLLETMLAEQTRHDRDA
jgi:hypothetical protein